ncbi:transposase family protein [Burkholderia sp. SCN-KJ]|uniref:transposase family protein n=1 Tax=Burkholderia sp. SCN-KJ TaxID=2969248 RepID=UPI00214FCC15|nr:transposase family protein [Burkholderia sp. SCN-KJ]MCR4471603.1 transposase family protein [Burkholderia sp. SCN-KJ]
MTFVARRCAPLTHCPHCNSDRLVGFGRRERLVRDLPMHGRRVGMYVGTQRMGCQPRKPDTPKVVIRCAISTKVVLAIVDRHSRRAGAS